MSTVYSKVAGPSIRTYKLIGAAWGRMYGSPGACHHLSATIVLTMLVLCESMGALTFMAAMVTGDCLCNLKTCLEWASGHEEGTHKVSDRMAHPRPSYGLQCARKPVFQKNYPGFGHYCIVPRCHDECAITPATRTSSSASFRVHTASCISPCRGLLQVPPQPPPQHHGPGGWGGRTTQASSSDTVAVL